MPPPPSAAPAGPPAPARPPLPFGLGRDPLCAPSRQIHDQVAQALSALFQTFFATSLQYLGVSEILDWVESSGTIDAWILTGLEQGRLPDELASKKNLEFGREAIRSVVQNALDAEEEAWATSLRETGFSSSVSMVYEGICGQLKTSKNAPRGIPCLHTLLTPTGLSMLKSAPMKSSFPTGPPRVVPSCTPLLASIRSLISSGALSGAHWKTPTIWRAQVRKAFAQYHDVLRQIAEELVSERSFAEEYYIFLENISQPLQLLQLVAEDFEREFGAGATRGLLGVGDVGGDNLISIMDFCHARKPSELLARVRQRVQEKQERERRAKEVEQKRAQLKELDGRIRALLLEYRSNGGAAASAVPSPAAPEAADATLRARHEEATRLQRELERALDERDAVKAEVEVLQAREAQDAEIRKKERAEKERALAAVGVRVEGGKLKSAEPTAAAGLLDAEESAAGSAAAAAPAREKPVTAGVRAIEARKDELVEEEERGCVVGTSRELIRSMPPRDPFATNAPRVVNGAIGSTKGKARAAVQPGMLRHSISPPASSTNPAAHNSTRYNHLRDFPLAAAASSRASSPAPTVSSSAAAPSSPASPRKSQKRAPPSSSTASSSPTRTRRKAKKRGSRLRPAMAAVDEPCCCPQCCPECLAAAEAAAAADEQLKKRADQMIDLTQRQRVLRGEELRKGMGFSDPSTHGTAESQSEEKVSPAPPPPPATSKPKSPTSPLLLRQPATKSTLSAPEISRSTSSDSMPELEELPSPRSASTALNMATDTSVQTAGTRFSSEELTTVPSTTGKKVKKAKKTKRGLSPAPPSAAPSPAIDMSRTASGASAGSMPALEPLPHADVVDDPPEVVLEADDAPASQPLGESTNTAAAAKKKRKKKKKSAAAKGSGGADSLADSSGGVDVTLSASLAAAAAADAALAASYAQVSAGGAGFSPLSRYPPPRCCPPDRCTGVVPNHAQWDELDALLYDTCLAGYKYELIGALPLALAFVRDTMAKQYLLAGGRMTTESGEPKEMDSYLAIAEQRGLWHSANYPPVQAWGQRVLAISLQKLVDVLRATLGDLCICKMSQHLDILREARARLDSCEQLDRQIPIDLPEIDQQTFMKWAHVQLREHRLTGPEWEARASRQYIVQDFLLSFSDAFDAAMDRLVLRDPLLLAEDVATLLEWQGGVRTFESALRLGAPGRNGIIAEFGTGEGLLKGTELSLPERRPLQAWGRLLELSAEARSNGTAFSRDLAEQEKQRGNEYFASGEFEKAIVSFTTASIIYPLEPTFCSNAAAARMKLGSALQYSEAIADCTIALAQDPRNIKALYRRGMALALTGHWKAAFADLKYLELNFPDCQPAKEALAWANERYAALRASGKISIPFSPPLSYSNAPTASKISKDLERTPTDEKEIYMADSKVDDGVGFMDRVDDSNLLANGKERPIETAEDIATRCISLEDDPTLPIQTFRMYFLGLGLTCFAAVLGQIFYFRPQTVYVSQLFLQVIAFILGKAWEQFLPGPKHGKFWAFVNPGTFNIKEHVAILIMSSTASSSAEAISVFAADELYYGIKPNYGVCIFTLMASQLFGFGIAGLMRAFCVFPTYIVYPNLVPVVNLFDALHRDKNIANQKKRLRFFWIIFITIFVWQWVPEFLAPTLTGISIFCLARRDSAWFTRIFGGSNGNEGLGMFSLCLDWNYVGSGGGSLGALFTPFTTQLSQYAGVGLCCILFTSMYATNAWNAARFPFLSQDLFYKNGSQYSQLTILNADYSLNETALEEQGLPWYAASNAMYYLGCNFAIGATLTHVGLWYWRPMLNAVKAFRTRSIDDPHFQSMRKYAEVPMWVYGAIMLGSFAMAMATCYTSSSQLPWWALIVAFLLSIFMFPFVCVIYAIAGFKTDVQQLAQMLGAALVPGNSQANIYGYNSTAQGLALARDLKMAQYTKLPPRITLWVQSLGTVIGAILQLVIMKSVIPAQREILLDVQGSNIWSGQQVQSFNSQAVAWGALAKHLYGPGSTSFIIPLGIIIDLATSSRMHYVLFSLSPFRSRPTTPVNLVSSPYNNKRAPYKARRRA
ncbi:hypothetical protein JCM10213v2_007456 [Rhodosporidiobolus nylandii]